MRNPSSLLQIRNFGQQVFPKKLRDFMEVFANATDSLFGYLFVDLHTQSSPILRLRTSIFDQPIIYQL